jgi:hypothetical protein
MRAKPLPSLALLATLCSVSTVLADEAQDMQFARAATYCAIMATESSELSGNRSKASSLASMGMEKARGFSASYAKLFSEGGAGELGPLDGFMRTVSPDFVLGMTISGWFKEAEDLLPKAGDVSESYEAFKLRKETMADMEFGKQNCSLLKP